MMPNLGVRIATISLLLLTAAAACTGPEIPSAPQTLRIAGSTTMQPMLLDLGSAFQTQYPNIVVEIGTGGSAMGLSALRQGRADLAAVSWVSRSEKGLQGYQMLHVATDALAVVVHPSNAAADVTLTQLRRLFSGEILDWSELGSPSGAPELVSREDGSGTRSAFEALVMGDDEVSLNAVVMPSTAEVVNYVASHESAVGYVTAAALGARVRALLIEGTLPSRSTLQSGTYYLVRGLYLLAADPASPQVEEFLDFVSKPVGRGIVNRYHLPAP